MPPQSRGNPLQSGFYSKSTPNLPTLRSLRTDAASATTLHPSTAAGEPRLSTDSWTSGPSEPASIEDFSLDAPLLSSSSTSSSENDDATPPTATDRTSSPSRISPLPPSRRPLSRSTTSFAPPFYNRPPTPLPPSPSLTSLLRPSFSAHPSRPTSPDRSSEDNARSTAARSPLPAAATLLTSSFRTARPVARASPKVPTYEYYGFTLYLASSAFFLVYVLWSFLPSPFLHRLGIHYYPNRWWALAVPAWLVMGVLWIYAALAAWNTERETLELRDVRTVVDEAAKVAGVDAKGRVLGRVERRATVTGRKEDVMMGGKVVWREVWDEGTDAVMDIPVGGVCEVLYGEERDREDDLL